MNRADSFRIRGVGEAYSDLLEAARVATVPELATRNPEHLGERRQQVNDRKNLSRRLPALPVVKTWIKQANKLPRDVEY